MEALRTSLSGRLGKSRSKSGYLSVDTTNHPETDGTVTVPGSPVTPSPSSKRGNTVSVNDQEPTTLAGPVSIRALPSPGDKAQVFSNSKKIWCNGKVKAIDDSGPAPLIVVTFKIPGITQSGSKKLPADSKDLRIIQASGRMSMRDRMRALELEDVNNQRDGSDVSQTADRERTQEIAQTVAKQLDSKDKSTQIIACKILGSMSEHASEFIPKLTQVAADKDEDLVCAATNALRLLGPRGMEALVNLCSHKEASVREAAVFQLGFARSARNTKSIAGCVQDKNEQVRLHAIEALAAVGAEGYKYVYEVAGALNDKKTDVSAAALNFITQACHDSEQRASMLLSHDVALARITGLKALAALSTYGQACLDEVAKLVDDEDTEVSEIATTLTKKACRTPATCVAMLKSDSTGARRIATEMLTTMGEEGAEHADIVVNMLSDKNQKTRCAAVKTLGSMGAKGAAHAKQVARLTSDPDPDVRLATIEALLAMGPAGKEFANSVVSLLQDADSNVRSRASIGLREMAATRSEQ
eukprot:TRINITY_DN87244_c0_g1_i1.p1 TRINITY_DN87244_c0_g1~~TRINITY_DN87244_c0_g1_i1.p1  ORF type:complete len:528 (-),score=96.91 TRINITY_DN87244_c0_g1_i1:62-1645(-)